MAVPPSLQLLAGHWQATHRLWLSPDEPVRESAATAAVTLAAQNKFLLIAYTWEEDGPQDGLLLIGQDAKSDEVTAAWIDAWHNGDRLMPCVGSVTPAGAFTVKGSYPAPEGSDWSWRLTVEPPVNDGIKDTWRFTMHNLTPEGEAQLAVEAVFRRR